MRRDLIVLAALVVGSAAGYGLGVLLHLDEPAIVAAVGAVGCSWLVNLWHERELAPRRPTRPTGFEHRDGGGPA
jgi:uncharacterized membrane protein YfcA